MSSNNHRNNSKPEEYNWEEDGNPNTKLTNLILDVPKSPNNSAQQLRRGSVDIKDPILRDNLTRKTCQKKIDCCC